MKIYTVQLTFSVHAEDVTSAYDLGIAAVEHLLDTFNDNQSIDPLVRIEAEPLKTRLS